LREDICDNTHKLLLGIVNAFRHNFGEKEISERGKIKMPEQVLTSQG
jgi:hypothetical protein